MKEHFSGAKKNIKYQKNQTKNTTHLSVISK